MQIDLATVCGVEHQYLSPIKRLRFAAGFEMKRQGLTIAFGKQVTTLERIVLWRLAYILVFCGLMILWHGILQKPVGAVLLRHF
jgi:hypothetical protein